MRKSFLTLQSVINNNHHLNLLYSVLSVDRINCSKIARKDLTMGFIII